MLSTFLMQLTPITSKDQGRLYSVSMEKTPHVSSFVFTCPETRRICNEPLEMGVSYTRLLKKACVSALLCLSDLGIAPERERDTSVFHILRGGLNFGLREALMDAFGWNMHQSTFVSSQRTLITESSEWMIVESDYHKIQLQPRSIIVFGDVVATGTSLEFALKRILNTAKKSNVSIDSIVFFTIGSARSSQILSDIISKLNALQNACQGIVVYFEGIFEIADKLNGPKLRIPGTDLLRTRSILSPEFLESQLEAPHYPLERCAIYDAGSRAFAFKEYLTDLRGYWQDVASEAECGVSYTDLIKDRFPEIIDKVQQDVSLKELTKARLTEIDFAMYGRQ